MTNDNTDWYDLDQFIGICFNEDMTDLYPATNYRESAIKAVNAFCRSQRRSQVVQVRKELKAIIDGSQSEEELMTIIDQMGNVWDFSPYREWGRAVLREIEASLGAATRLGQSNARLDTQTGGITALTCVLSIPVFFVLFIIFTFPVALLAITFFPELDRSAGVVVFVGLVSIGVSYLIAKACFRK
jgi:hypothetical protein